MVNFSRGRSALHFQRASSNREFPLVDFRLETPYIELKLSLYLIIFTGTERDLAPFCFALAFGEPFLPRGRLIEIADKNSPWSVFVSSNTLEG
jgi:hypothetical protein